MVVTGDTTLSAPAWENHLMETGNLCVTQTQAPKAKCDQPPKKKIFLPQITAFLWVLIPLSYTKRQRKYCSAVLTNPTFCTDSLVEWKKHVKKNWSFIEVFLC